MQFRWHHGNTGLKRFPSGARMPRQLASRALPNASRLDARKAFDQRLPRGRERRARGDEPSAGFLAHRSRSGIHPWIPPGLSHGKFPKFRRMRSDGLPGNLSILVNRSLWNYRLVLHPSPRHTTAPGWNDCVRSRRCCTRSPGRAAGVARDVPARVTEIPWSDLWFPRGLSAPPQWPGAPGVRNGPVRRN